MNMPIERPDAVAPAATLRARFRRPVRQRGVAALETAFVLVPALLMFAFLASFGFFFLLKQNIAHATGEAARVLVSASMKSEPGAEDKACLAARMALAETSRWLGLAGPLCCVEPAAQAAGALPQVTVSVSYANDPDSRLYGVLNLFSHMAGRQDDRLLSSLLGSMATAQVVMPLEGRSCRV